MSPFWDIDFKIPLRHTRNDDSIALPEGRVRISENLLPIKTMRTLTGNNC